MKSCEIACFDFNEITRVAPAVLCVGEAFAANLLEFQSENLISGIWKAENKNDNFILKRRR